MWTYYEENQTYINIINSFVERIGSRYPTKILVDNEIEDLSGQYINGFYSSPGKYSEISAYSSITNIYHPFVLNYLIKCEEEKIQHQIQNYILLAKIILNFIINMKVMR